MSKKDKSDQNWFKRHKILSGIIIFFGLILLVNGLGGGSPDSDTNNNADSSAKSSEKSESTAKLGESARDGKFEFIVKSVKCGEKVVGTNEYAQEKATGQFCRLSLSIKNIGDEAQSLFADNIKLVDSQNKEYSYDSTATIYAEDNSAGSTWMDQINPGNSVSGDIIFDVPLDADITTAVLHDSAFSNGVKVNLK